jgi:3-isopropylmalate/(R)-2-methylmalate dehydratase small subunit
VDTDQIIPAHHLKRTARTGYGEFAFEGWRRDPGFVLNNPGHAGAPILVGGPNFGCGSSREHAAWALQEMGLEVIIAPSFADIFRTNCVSVGILTVALPATTCSDLIKRATADPSDEIEVDLMKQTVRTDDGRIHEGFTIDPADRHRLLNGLDPIGASVERLGRLDAFENGRHSSLPNLAHLVSTGTAGGAT